MSGPIVMATPWGPPTIPGDIQEGGPLVPGKPSFIPANGVAKVLVRHTTDGEPCENVIYVVKDGTEFTYDGLETLANTVKTSWVTNMIPLMHMNVFLTGVVASDAQSQTGPVFELDVEPQVQGLNLGTPAPATLCIGVGFHTGFKGRSANGRLFQVGNVDADFALGLPSDVSRTNTLTGISNVMNDLAAGGYKLVLVSYRSGDKWRTAAQVTTIVLISAGQFIYTMRRRLKGHNRHR